MSKWLGILIAGITVVALAIYFIYRTPSVEEPGPSPTPVATASPTPVPTAEPSPSPTSEPVPEPTPQAGLPELPRVTPSLTEADAKPLKTVTVATAADLQKAINEASLGTEILLEPGTYKGPFKLPNKTEGSGWITIRPASMEGVPARGTRVDPSKLKVKLQVETPESVLVTEYGAHHYRFIGLEIAVPETVTKEVVAIIRLGHGRSYGTVKGQDTLEQQPHHFIFERVYVHGNSQGDVRRGFSLNSGSTIIADSFITECHHIGQDAQAIGGWNGSGPYLIQNNYLEGSTENILFGGDEVGIPELVPSDITITGNHLFKPLSWKKDDPSFKPITRACSTGTCTYSWTVKNLFELKSARRVLFKDNLLEHSWLAGQVGYAILLTPRGENNTPWAVVEDVTLENNVIKKAGAGVQISGADDGNSSGGGKSKQQQRVLFKNNRFEDIGVFAGAKRIFSIGKGLDFVMPKDLHIEGNTLLGVNIQALVTVGDAKKNADGTITYPILHGFKFINNMAVCGTYGFKGGGEAPGDGTIRTHFKDPIIEGNSLIGCPPASYKLVPNNKFPKTLAEAGL